MVHSAVPHCLSRGLGRLVLGLALAGCLAWVLGSGPSGGSERAAVRSPLVDRSLFRVFVSGDPRHTLDDDPAVLRDYEHLLGASVQVVSAFYGVGDVFPGSRERLLAAGGRRAVLLSWDMGSGRAYRFTAWTSGRHDAYLRRIGRAAAAYPYQVYVRPWPEMNGDWVPFQPTASGSRPAGGTPAQFIKAWRHVVDTVRHAGGTNIRWVFDPAADVYPGTTDVRRIWPGRRWVDSLGLDGYNWGNVPGHGLKSPRRTRAPSRVHVH